MTTIQQAGPEIRAAGGVVTRTRLGEAEFLIVHRPRYDDWSLPKGKLEPDEEFPAAAVREVEEETGSIVSEMAPLGSVAYNSNGDNPKVVRYWLFEHTSGDFTANSEVDEIRWARTAEALEIMTYQRDRNVLAWGAALIDDPTAGRVHLVRHAKAGSRTKWTKPDDLRPLTAAGRDQALGVADALTATPVTALRSSAYRRCIETLEPLAASLGAAIELGPGLTEGDATSELVGALEDVEARSVVMCSHGAEIAALLGELKRRGAPLDLPSKLPGKGAVWSLDLSAGSVTAARYTPPPG